MPQTRTDREIAKNDATEGGGGDPCAAAAAKVARQKPGSARRKIAERELAECRRRNAQTTDSNN
jgi:hypothetical protein